MSDQGARELNFIIDCLDLLRHVYPHDATKYAQVMQAIIIAIREDSPDV